jgi:Activator of Hsp90 ATPase homolog 1-like protein
MMNKNLIITKERNILADTKKVWDVLTETKTDWNGVTIETKSEWKPNSEIIFSFVWEGKQYADKGVIIEFEPKKIFSHTYWSAFSGLPDQEDNYSKVHYDLASTDTGTILKLTHSNFATETMYEHSDKNWEDTLDKIKAKCER